MLLGGLVSIVSRFDSERLQEVMLKALPIAGILVVTVVVSLRRVFGPERVDNQLMNLAVAMVSLVSVLLIAEFSIRQILPKWDGLGTTIAYSQTRWKRDIRVNALGYREREIDLTNAGDSFRIAVIGDSFTFGQGVREDDRFTNILQVELDKTPGIYEVLNFSRPGAETVHHLQMLENDVLNLRPDFILLQWYVNDVEGADKTGRPSPIVIVPAEFRENSAFLSLFHDLFMSLQERAGLTESYDDYMVRKFSDPSSRASEEAQQALAAFMDVASENGIPVGIVLFDRFISRDSQLGFLLDRTLVLCEERAIQCLDLRGTFEPYKGNRVLWANWGDRHPSPFAHGLVAESILEKFGEAWGLPK